jgi:hypothetical protein
MEMCGRKDRVDREWRAWRGSRVERPVWVNHADCGSAYEGSGNQRVVVIFGFDLGFSLRKAIGSALGELLFDLSD